MSDPPADDVRRSLVRGQVLGRLEAGLAVDARERRSLEEFLVAFDRLDAPFDEHADPVHVTGSAIVVGPRGVVLHRHKRLGLWLQPGGHVDPGETPWVAARREAAEETGLVVGFPDESSTVPPLFHVDVHPGPRGHTHLDLRYVVVGGSADPAPPAGESPEVHWFGLDEAIDLADEGLVGALRSWRGREWCDTEGSPGLR